MSAKMKFPMKKLALGVSSAIVVLGAQPASADAIVFPYVVNGGNVTTILSAATTAPIRSLDARFADTLHYAYNSKSGVPSDPLEPWTDPCVEINFYNPSSIGDIVTFNVGTQLKAAANGVLFESNPFVPPLDPSKKVIYPENFGQFPAGHRGYVTVDNNNPIGSAGSDGTLYGEALVLDITVGAAWGYRAYNPRGDQENLTGFGWPNDTLGEVLTSTAPPSSAPDEAAAFEMYPGVQFSQKMLITPIPDLRSSTTPLSAASGNKQPLVVARVSARLDNGVFSGTALYDRDENPISGRFDIPVVCVGAPDLKEFFTSGALTKYVGDAATGYGGGWTTISSFQRNGDPNIGTEDSDYTGDMIAQKLSFTAGPIEGVAIGGTLNSALWLQSTRLSSQGLPVGETNGFLGSGINDFAFRWATNVPVKNQ